MRIIDFDDECRIHKLDRLHMGSDCFTNEIAPGTKDPFDARSIV